MPARTTPNGSATALERENRMAALELKVDTLTWLHAELSLRFLQTASALAALLAQQMQPQVQQAILAQLTGASPPPM